MDPALQELIGRGDGDELLEAIIKLDSPSRPPPGVQLVARFGDVCTCRVRRRDVQAIHADPAVLAFKAPRLLASIDREARQLSGLNIEQRPGDIRRPPDIQQTGKGVYLCVLDWGADFALDSLIDTAGNTRFKAIWNQAAKGQGAPASPYGYGRVYDRDDINAALRFRDPYEALGYHPADGDPTGRGAHGTHVLDIAGGNGRGGGPLGMAPESELIFVHLASARLGGLADLGDSVRLLEGLDFVRRMAGDKPWCVNMSLGRHGGAHTGRSLVEQAMDNLLAEAPGRAIAQSCGNYYKARAHASGYVAPGKIREFVWQTDKADKTANELEIFYSGSDHFRVTITPPTGGEPFSAPLGGNVDITSRGTVVGRLYHRAKDSVTGDHHVDIFLFRGAPAGDWTVSLLGEKIVDGRYSAWIERDATCGGCQSRFLPEDAARETTLGSICNGFHTVVTGAYDAHDVAGNLASVSSAGPTRDGRQKPDIVAPGRRVLAARSTPRGSRPTNDFFRLTGTSMASPHVAGTLALMFEAAPRPLTIHETRRQLIGSARQPVNMSEDEAHRFGAGYLDVTAAVNAAADLDSISGTTIEITSIMAQTDSGGELESVPMLQEEKIMTYEQTDILDDLMPPITKRPPSINPDPRRIPNLVERLLRLIPSSYLREFHIDETNLPAHIFDAYTTRSGHPLRPLLDQVFNVEVGPGEYVNVADLPENAILIRRALADGHMAHIAAVFDEGAGGVVPEMASGGILDQSSLILTPKEGAVDFSPDLGPLGIAIAGAFAGALFSRLLAPDGTKGGYDVTPAAASHVWTKGPPEGLPLYRRMDKLKFKLEKYGFDKTAVFNLELNYDGFNIIRASVSLRAGDSSSLGGGHFGHSLEVKFAGKELGRSDLDKAPVLQIMFPFHGTWDPFGPGNDSFSGFIIVSGDGKVTAQMDPSSSDWIRISHKKGRRQTIQAGQPQPPAPPPGPQQPVTPQIDLQRAIQENRRLGVELGWASMRGAISIAIGYTDISPDDGDFALGVARWQANNGISPSGIIDRATWKRMEPFLISATPARRPRRRRRRASLPAPQPFIINRGIEVFYGRGVNSLSQGTVQSLTSWFGSLPAQLQKEIKSGKRAVSVFGFASPEGSRTVNQRISDARAQAARAALQSIVGQSAIINAVGRGEVGPDRLRKALIHIP